MKHSCNIFDLWIFHRQEGVPRYLLMHTSQENAGMPAEFCLWKPDEA